MSVPKATTARRAYNRALRDLDRELRTARDAARDATSLTGTSSDARFVGWVRGVEHAIERARRLAK